MSEHQVNGEVIRSASALVYTKKISSNRKALTDIFENLSILSGRRNKPLPPLPRQEGEEFIENKKPLLMSSTVKRFCMKGDGDDEFVQQYNIKNTHDPYGRLERQLECTNYYPESYVNCSQLCDPQNW